jgi:hypothetical protein
MPKFIFTELVDLAKVVSARLGAGTGSSNFVDDKECGKFVRLVGDSRYNLCAVGEEIEGRISSVEVATYDNFSFGGVQVGGRFECTFDGLQGTPGTGTLAVGDIVVCGTPVAKGTALTFGTPARVCKATTPANVVSKWRVVSLGAAGTGAVGTQGLIERI